MKSNWVNLTDNDFDDCLSLINKDVKSGKSETAIFQLFSRGVATGRDEWVYDFSKDDLINRSGYLIEVYQERLKHEKKRELDIKWDRELEKYISRGIEKKLDKKSIVHSIYRPFVAMYLYFDKHFNGMTYQLPNIFPNANHANLAIWLKSGTEMPFFGLAIKHIPDVMSMGGSQCLPPYRYEKNGDRVDNITDWGLTQFQTHYNDPTITKEHIFHYTYAILHHPAYRTKYAINLKREFPRLPFYPDFHQWATWGQTLMALHLNYETIAPYGLKRTDKQRKTAKPKQENLFDTPEPKKPIQRTIPKAKLQADKTDHKIILDTDTELLGIPPIAWDYKLGNRSALEWILDQYKEKTPKDPTIRAKFNTYKFADYKEHVIDLLDRVCTVSIKTMEIIQQMPDTVDHQGDPST